MTGPRHPPGAWRSRLVVRERGYITPCHEWTGATDSRGYGQVRLPDRLWRVHRLAWTEAYGPTSLHVLHKCDNPLCARLDHLFVGTDADNVADKMSKGRWGPTRNNLGERGPAKLTEADVRAIRASNENNSALSRRFGVDRKTIRDIRSRQTWRHI